MIREGKLNPKVIISVDLFGLPAEYEKIIEIAEKYNLKVIEDAAQGLGGSISGKKSGSFGDIATTSFFPAKPLGCYGDGGAVFTNNDSYAEHAKSLRVHGKGADKYDNIHIGMNSRLDTIQAAILLEKLNVFEEELNQRNEVAKRYTENLEKMTQIRTPTLPDKYFSSWAQYTLKIESEERRGLLIDTLKSAGIPTGIYYPKPLHLQPVFNDGKHCSEDCKTGTYLSKHSVSLPMHPYLDENMQQNIIDCIVATLSK